MVFVCYLLLKEANINIDFICFDENFDLPHVNVVIFVPRKQSKKATIFFKKSSIVHAVRLVVTF